jgi:photosystem II stability/assembly factor-like uncharacterized protein
MKKIFTILIASVLLSVPLKAQWQQTLTGQGSLMDAVSVVTDSVIWIKDQMGEKFSITKDAGKTWTTKSFPIGLATNRICGSFSAVSDKVAFVIVSMASATATQGIYKTTDGGDTWIRQVTAFNSSASFPDLVYFWNENEGVIVGDGISNANGILEIYTTTNGGAQWNAVPAANMPSASSPDWGINTNSFIRVRGNTVYVMAGSGWIYKSVNKGLNWTATNTPALNNGTNAKFDFKDDNNGLLSIYNTTSKASSVYSTTNAGVNWVKVDSTSGVREIKYVGSLNTYFGTGPSGLSYSTNNGISWTKHPSFVNVGLQALSVTPSGTIYVGGWSYVYNTFNYAGVNLSVTKSKLTGSKSIDLTFSSNVDLTSAQDTANYLVNYRVNNVTTYTKIPLLSATVDATNKSLVHLVTTTELPIDTCYINVYNVKGINNISVINKSASAYSTIIRTSLNDYSTVKYGLIGSSYFLNNTLNGTKAQWNICWKDAVNNIQPSVPVISGGGKVFTWTFPGVLLIGGATGDGMFKFSLVNTDNTPNWSVEPIGYPQMNAYTGSAVADVDKLTDGGGAFIILTSGLVKKYNLQLIIDQTSGIDQITLDINGVNTATNPININDEVIVGYRVYNESGKLVTTGESPGGMNLQNLKSTLHKGVYLMNAKLNTGHYYNYKFVVQ